MMMMRHKRPVHASSRYTAERRIARRVAYKAHTKEQPALRYALALLHGVMRPFTTTTMQGHTAGFAQRLAFSAGEIDRAVQQALQKEHIPMILADKGLSLPDIKYGDIFKVTMNSLARKWRLDRQQREDMLAEVLGDMIVGQSLSGIIDRGPWKHTLASQIQEWVASGMDQRHIEATLARWITHKLGVIYNRWILRNQDAPYGIEQGDDDGGGGGSESKNLLQSVLSLDTVDSRIMGNYHSMLRHNPQARDIVLRIGEMLDQRYDDLGLIWQAYTEDPGASIRELLAAPVYPEARAPHKIPLWQALGYAEDSGSNPGKLHNQIKNLRKVLRTLWPEIDRIIAEMP